MFKNRVEMKRKLLLLAIMLFATLLLNGCGLHVNINKGTQNVEEMLANQALTADPVAYNADGSYTVTFQPFWLAFFTCSGVISLPST